jgi:hypothetical protein
MWGRPKPTLGCSAEEEEEEGEEEGGGGGGEEEVLISIVQTVNFLTSSNNDATNSTK